MLPNPPKMLAEKAFSAIPPPIVFDTWKIGPSSRAAMPASTAL
jgi:hypothetical protein